jgi:hypothetical protein
LQFETGALSFNFTQRQALGESIKNDMENKTTAHRPGSAETARPRLITGMFRDRQSAEKAYGALSARGYSRDDISLVMHEDTRKKYFTEDGVNEMDNKAWEGAGVGSAIGGALGAIVGALVAIGTSIALPGLGLIVAGPLAAGLAGAGAGSITGGLVGALVGAGIPEERARVYEEGLKSGGIVMGVEPKSDEDATHIETEWKTYNGEEIHR